ncbi:MAG: DegV family protein [Eubacteriales bacterium]|nr:DegV family protein [Eubacteriales bacterium]
MSKIKIATDSTADIPKDLCEKLNISVLPLTIIHEDNEYRDGIDISKEDFYHILETAQKLPSSSQVKVNMYTRLFTRCREEGYTDLIQVTLNSKGSGTFQAAELAKALFFESHPEAIEKFRIHIIDSKTYSMAYGLPVIEAAQMIDSGANVQEVIDHIEEWLVHSRPLFVPLNLKCVKKSGRISPAAAFVGDVIGLKPLITFEDGEAKIIGKARGEKSAISALIDRCINERKPGTNYVLVYGNNSEAFEQLKRACEKNLEIPPLVEYQVGCVIGINTGPNMIGILYRT